LPQLLNVLKGEMSLVGPRPYFKNELSEYAGNNRQINAITRIRPGMTGLWQVSGRNDIHIQERIKIDATYAQERTLWGDLCILLKTPYVVVTRKGAK